MKKPIFRNPDKLQVLPFREWIRDMLPPGSAGVVVEDLDLVIRVYGKRYDSDGVGKFMLIELKYGQSWIGIAHKRTFGLIHDLLRKADPHRQRYMGYFVVQYTNEDWYNSQFAINKKHVSMNDFLRFLQFDSNFIESVPRLNW